VAGSGRFDRKGDAAGNHDTKITRYGSMALRLSLSFLSNFGLKFAPDSIHSGRGQDDWARVPELGGLAMGIANPPQNKQDCLDESTRRDDESTDDILSLLEENARLRGDESPLWGDEHTDDVVSLLEENARLRGLVIKLSNIILRNVVDRR
jgi:hypothetical protein